MILYLDTSAFVKAYIEEEHSSLVHEALKKARASATHDLTYVEAHSAFARLQRQKDISEVVHAELKQKLSEDWPAFIQLALSQELLERAADLCEIFSLKAYDSMHLTAAEQLRIQSGHPVLWACFDKQLNQAAKVLGLSLLAS